ncbi:DUF2628 domain-containing protein [Terrihabitans sp. B22-R8]|uniref:DUF2628 domain-containing protein n=1 Tax=Terrihabitans sp. B22-R8 TaxID=3425128 RepID=UPI00403C0F11
MRIWTVHEPRSAKNALERADRLVVVKDGFSWLAFFFSLPWLLYNRLWLGTLIYLLVTAAIGLLGAWLPLAGGAEFLLGIIPALYAGFEGNDLRRRKLARRDFVQVASIAAKNGLAAETEYFTVNPPIAAVEQAPAPKLPDTGRFAAALRPQPDNSVLGLFPQPGPSR